MQCPNNNDPATFGVCMVDCEGREGEKGKLPWNVDWELVVTADWIDTEVSWDWWRGEEDRLVLREGDEGGTWEDRWRFEEVKLLTGPWTKSLNPSSSSEKPVLELRAWAWGVKPEVDEEKQEKEEGVSTGPWKSLNSSLSSDIVVGREWVETDGCDGDESAKIKK